jgi:hypothetical protein
MLSTNIEYGSLVRLQKILPGAGEKQLVLRLYPHAEILGLFNN